MNRFSYFESLCFELLIFLFVNNNLLQVFEVKRYSVELKNKFHTSILYERKLSKK